jgi:hypothetical protein
MRWHVIAFITRQLVFGVTLQRDDVFFSAEKKQQMDGKSAENFPHNKRQLKMNCHTWYNQSHRCFFLFFFHPSRYSLNFLRVIKLCCISFITLFRVGGWDEKALNQIGLLSFNILSLFFIFRRIFDEWKFILFALDISPTRAKIEEFLQSAFLVFALIKLCFDCQFAAEYVIKADLREESRMWAERQAT